MKFQKDNTLLTGRLKSLGYACKGALKLISTEHSVMVQFSLGIIMTIAGFYFEISRTEWMFQILAIGLVLSIEGLNKDTVIEGFTPYDRFKAVSEGMVKEYGKPEVVKLQFAGTV